MCVANRSLLLSLGLISAAVSYVSVSLPDPLRRSTLAGIGSSTLRRQSSKSSASSWQSHVSTHPDTLSALSELLLALLRDPEKPRPQLAFLFVGPTHAASFGTIVQHASSSLPASCRLLSVVGGGVVGANVELDEPDQPSMAILAGAIPSGTSLDFISINFEDKMPPPPESEYWKWLSGRLDSDGTSASSSYIVFADPWSPIQAIIQGLTSSSGSGVVVGGVSVPTAAQPTVAMDGQVMPQGSAAGLRFKGSSMGIQAIVAQGCRPVGPIYTITSVDKNCILQLDSQPALQALEAFIRQAPEEVQQQIGSCLVCGIASVNRDDYLVRQIMAFLPSQGGIALAGGLLEVGDRLRFHVRDKTTAQEDLQLMVKRAKTERLFQSNLGTPIAALQISCAGRGRALFGIPNFDLSNVQELVAQESAVGGFFANGEIGPVGVAGFSNTKGGTYLHGFTTVIALLCDYSATAAPDDSADDGHALSDETAVAWE
jgi:small ligand-binding sensory domain FIST